MFSFARKKRDDTVCPRASGEDGAAGRGKKKPDLGKSSLLITMAAIAIAAAAAVFFPACTAKKETDGGENDEARPYAFSADENVALDVISYDFYGESPYVRIKWTNYGTGDFTLSKAFAAYVTVEGSPELRYESGAEQTYTLAPGESKTLLYGLSMLAGAPEAFKLRLLDKENDTYAVTVVTLQKADVLRNFAEECDGSGCRQSFTLYKDGTFSYSPGIFSSTVYAPGKYAFEGDALVLEFGDERKARLEKRDGAYVCVTDKSGSPVRGGSVFRDTTEFMALAPKIVVNGGTFFCEIGAGDFEWRGEKVTVSGEGGTASFVEPVSVTGTHNIYLSFSSYDPENIDSAFLASSPNSMTVTVKRDGRTVETVVHDSVGTACPITLEDGLCTYEVSALWAGAGSAKYTFTAERVAPENQGARIVFYPEPCDEGTPIVSGKTASRKLSAEEEKKLRKIVGSYPRTDDYVCDREAFYGFAGCFELDGTLYSFSYKNKIIYFDHYFIAISDEDVDLIKNLK